MTEKALTEKTGDLMVPHSHLAQWTRFRVFKGMLEQVSGSAQGGGKFYLEALEFWQFMVVEHQHWIFLDSGPSASERTLAMSRSFDLGGEGMGVKCLVPDVVGGQSSLLCICCGRMTCSFGRSSLKSNSGPF